MNVLEQNKEYVKKQLQLIYITEKYYRNGFVDDSQLVIGCFDK